MKKIFQNITVTFIALLLCLLCAEAAVRCYFHVTPNYDFEMWRYASELKQPLSTAALPFKHWASKGGKYYGVELRMNSLGMRSPEIAPVKPAGRRRIIFLGDSYTLGWGVPFEDTFSRLLEKKLNKGSAVTEVINMGVGNYNSSMEVELFKQKGLDLDPSLVVLMYYINDVEPTPGLGKLSYWLQKHFYLLGSMRTKLRQLAMMGEGSDWLGSYYRKIYDAGAPGRQQNSQSLRELAALCRSRGIRLLIVNIPDLRRLDTYPFSYATQFIRSIAEENRVTFLDLLPVFETYPGRSLWVSSEDSHMNSKASALASEAIFNKIMSESLLDAR